MSRFRRLSQALQCINTAVFLHAAYILGIGVVSIVGRLFGARFLDEKAKKTNWKKPMGSKDPDRMY